ncbi:heterokaryon incompatibility protein-domain-containing protein [Cercophora newfieldiana]|uniref:Heterokaryon incompatibility protein-domain-containing protein n=1 Tax=Cercophora newfieldiana TaxID=92897 RepID=A0AA39Y9E2_9PEZI|nr:heterokaryon incompatibility protein-domain-containing protein [Cercophora newfieldiana]
MSYDDPDLDRFPEYEYEPLAHNKKMVRLMELYPGESFGGRVYCELITVVYDKRFHIPTMMAADDPRPREGEGGQGDQQAGSAEADDDRSDYEKLFEQREKESEEARKQRLKRQGLRRLNKFVNKEKATKERVRAETERELDQLVKDYEKVRKNQVAYEALSWTWGKADDKFAILIKKGDKTYKKRVRKELALALKYLRRPGKKRVLWIDAVCIDQDDLGERNHQVQMMSRIYTRSEQVCVWLGEADSDSEMAINFIRDEIRELRNFDTISSNTEYSKKWRALMSLMQREWFFRRWVVQEIALAGAATVYCGPHSVPWKSFAVAVELFVEVETATHRLSEVMGRDEKLRHVPGWFEYVSELGASLLVQATGKLFRTRRTPMQQDPDSSDEDIPGDDHDRRRHSEEAKALKKKVEEDRIRQRLRETQTIDPLERRSLLSLEYLVTTMFIFKATEPRDVVYALLAIARDAAPFAPTQYGEEDRKLFLVMSLLDRIMAEKPFVVDYNRPYSDVSRDFVEFCIKQTHKTDPTQALDILCRPWALEAPRGRSIRLAAAKTTPEEANRSNANNRLLRPKRTAFKQRTSLRVEQRVEAPWYWEERGRRFKYRYLDDENPVWKPDYRSNEQYVKELDKTKWVQCCNQRDCDARSEGGPECKGQNLQWEPSKPEGWEKIKKRYFPADRCGIKDITLPTWVARASRAPFMLDNAPGMEMSKTSRANADPLVGPPQDGHRNYNAAGPEKLDLEKLRFKKRPVMGHYSLYVRGFELDEVVEVADASQLGCIPMSWLQLAGWEDLDNDPPDEFWRTIVADRGRDNRNPPYYYARACQESVTRGGHLGGSVNTAALIHDEQNSIVAEFCRRVHAVIWNRSLFRTKHHNRLGLATHVREGDKVCVLYGSTVPVILRQNQKRPSNLESEAEEDRVETLKKVIRQAVANRERKGKQRREAKRRQVSEDERQALMDAVLECAEVLEQERQNKEKSQDQEDQEKKQAKLVREKEVNRAKKVAEEENGVEDAKRDQEEAQRKWEEAQKREGVAKAAFEKAPANQKEAAQKGLDEARKAVAETEEAAREAVSNHKVLSKTARQIRSKAEKEAMRDAEEEPGPETPQTSWIVLLVMLLWTRSNRIIWYLLSFMVPAGLRAGASPTLGKSQLEGRTASREEESSATESKPCQSNTESDDENFWYEFVGDCYVHGMMDGEAMREKFYDDEKKDKTFELR